MPIPMPRHARNRRRLLGGAATAAALLFALSAHAQTAPVQAQGARVSTNDQSAPDGLTLADTSGNSVRSVLGPVDDAIAEIRANTVDATARINASTQQIDVAPLDDAGAIGTGIASLSAGTAGVTARGGTLIASRQSSGAAEVDADIFDTPLGLDAGAASGSHLTVFGNTQAANARGNDASADIIGSAPANGGSGIVSSQGIGAGGGVAARVRQGAELVAGPASASSLELSDNRATASADGNAVETGLAVSGATLFVPLSDARASTVAGSGNAAADAVSGILVTQSAQGTIKALAGDIDGGPAFRTAIEGTADGVRVAADGNLLTATVAGNRSANATDLDLVRVGTTGGSALLDGEVADITNVQRTTDASIGAMTLGGTVAELGGALSDSSVSLSGNQVQAAATANLTSNRLALSAATIAPDSAAASGPSRGAWVDADGNVLTDSALSIQNVQDYGSSGVRATVTDSAAKFLAGDVGTTSIVMHGNAILATAAGNRGTNALAVDAGSFGASVAVNNVQAGDGDVIVAIGDLLKGSGVLIQPTGTVENSRITASGNVAAGTALGNAASNNLSVAASQIRSGGNARQAHAGTIDTGYGAEGAFALASNQKLGTPGAERSRTPAISSTVDDRIGFGGGTPVVGSSIAIEDNDRSASALGNTVVNRLRVSAATAEPNSGASLSAFQYGQADVTATLATPAGTSGALDGATVSLARNTSSGLAAINDADNALTAGTGTLSDAGGSASATADPMGPPSATGDHALANQQFASGSATALVQSGTGNVQSDTGMADATYRLTNNATIAEASANRAANAISASAVTGSPNIALANGQTSLAQVDARASGGAGYAAPVAAANAVTGSTILLDGNSTSALARGNASDNRIDLAGSRSATAASSRVTAAEATIDGAAALLNSQTNYGAVAATAWGRGYLPLNAGNGAVQGSSLTASSNSIAASA